jgi:hypothetical protein
MPDDDITFVVFCGTSPGNTKGADQCKALLPPALTGKYNVIWHQQSTAIADLAAIAHCDHAVITLGTYSFWGGFLTGGHVVAMRDQWLKEKKIQQSEGNQDFYLPTWTVLQNECEGVSAAEMAGVTVSAKAEAEAGGDGDEATTVGAPAAAAAATPDSTAPGSSSPEALDAEATAEVAAALSAASATTNALAPFSEAAAASSHCLLGTHFCWRNFLVRPEDEGKADATCEAVLNMKLATSVGAAESRADYVCTCPDDYPEQRPHHSHEKAAKSATYRHMCGVGSSSDAGGESGSDTMTGSSQESASRERAAAELAATVSFGSKQGVVSSLTDESGMNSLVGANSGDSSCGLPVGHFLEFLCEQTNPITSFTTRSPLHILKIINRDDGAGFFATLTDVLNHLIWAESEGLTPLVNFSNIHYGRGGEAGLDMWTEYFAPVGIKCLPSVIY